VVGAGFPVGVSSAGFLLLGLLLLGFLLLGLLLLGFLLLGLLLLGLLLGEGPCHLKFLIFVYHRPIS